MFKQRRLYPYLGATNEAFDTRSRNRCGQTLVDCTPPTVSAVLFGHCSEAPHVKAYKFIEGVGYGDAYALPSLPLDSSGNNLFVSPSGNTVVLGSEVSPFVHLYPFSTTTGFGADHGGVSELTSEMHLTAFHPDSSAVAIYARENTPSSVRAYPLTEGTGVGTKYADPATVWPSILDRLFWHASGNAVIGANTSASPFIHAYPFNLVTGFGSKFSDPSSLPGSGFAQSVAHNSDMSVVAFTGSASPYLHAYQFSASTGFGTKYSQPATPVPTMASRMAFSPTDGGVLLARTTSPFAVSYVFDFTTGFGAKHADVSPALPGAIRGLAFHPSGAAVVMLHNTAPFVTAYAWSDATGMGAKYADPSVAIPIAPTDDMLRFSTSGDTLFIGHKDGSPYVTAYPFDVVDGFGTAYTAPVGLPTTFVQAIRWVSP